MARWLIQLVGADAQDFSIHFPTGDIHVLREGQDIFVTGVALEKYSDAAEVHGAANEWLDQAAAVSQIIEGSSERPTLGTIFREEDDGSRKGVGFMSGTASVRFKARANLDGATGPTTAQMFLARVQKDPFLQNAAMVWSEKAQTWPRLYRVLEELERSLGTQPDKVGFCSANDLKRFRRSANVPEVAGTDSRHAPANIQPPAKPMSLHEATNFIRELFEKTLRRPARSPAK